MRRPPGARAGALWVPVAAWTVIALIGAVVIDHLGRGLTFFFDEWDFVIGRRAGWSDALWQPHNGHLSVLPVLAYRAMFALVGLEHYRAYRWMGIAAHLARGHARVVVRAASPG